LRAALKPCPYLFVYGSLRSDAAPGRQPRLADWGHRLHQASLPGTLEQVDGYPMAVPGPGGVIRGEVWEILEPDAAWPALDAWEGPLYRRELVGVTLDVLDLTLECWAYTKA
jgi:gamma-glutamylcyclotransferase (GGCT)/AIG2-like uncharacterized protein YtfP